MDAQEAMTVPHSGRVINFNSIPPQSHRAILSRGLTHFLGNEQSAKTGPNSSWAGKFEKENGRKPTEDEVNAQKAANVAAAIAALEAGTVGTARGPKLDPVEAEMDRIAEREVWDTLAGANLCKKNKKPKDEDEFAFANGDKFTFEALVGRRLEKHGDRITKEATKKVEAERKAAERRKAEAAKATAAGPADVAALDL